MGAGKRGKSKYLGVSKHSNIGSKWSAQYWCSKTRRQVHLGCFSTEEEAGSAYARAVRKQQESAVGEPNDDSSFDADEEDEGPVEEGTDMTPAGGIDPPMLRPSAGSSSEGSSDRRYGCPRCFERFERYQFLGI